MKSAAHSAADGSFGRSAGVAAGRAALLLGVAVLLGLVLLNTTDADPVGVTTDTTVDSATDTTVSESEGEEPVDAAPLARPPGEVGVLVANATRTEGAAARITERLRVAGYMVKPPTDAPKEDASVVHFTSGYETEAQIVAETLELPPTVVQPMPTPAPVSDLREAHVLVLVGPELAKAPEATTTTAA
ncbi:MAG: LytR C-terminal domain-containing protein [Actinobacteria bacterium]|nr:LytR C-terminal domain-containing protein [Actinomycetota bacterium]